jgi:phosphoglycerate dehydrogenase-like enzyme
MRVACLSPLPADFIRDGLPDDLDPHVDVLDERTSAGAARLVRGADLVLGDFSDEVAVTQAVADAMDAARLFHQPHTGYDVVDVDALAARGIPMTTAGRAASLAMAEHTVMATLALLRSLVWRHEEVRAGRWPQHEITEHHLVDLHGRTVGLVGFGGAGEEAARRFAAFGVRLLYTARTRRSPDVEQAFGVTWASLPELLSQSDVVCLLVDLNEGTRLLIDADALARMKPSAFLVNPARGEVVDEKALHTALARGGIAGAALDVFATEPPAGSPLLDLGNVLLSPHVAGATAETRGRMMARAFDVLTHAGRGHLPDGVVNGVAQLRLVR